MPTMQITLSEPLQQFVLGRVAELGLECPDQYFEQLLEEEQRRKRDDLIVEKVREGLASGPPIPVSPGFWDAIADEVEQKCGRKVAR